MYCNTVGRNK